MPGEGYLSSDTAFVQLRLGATLVAAGHHPANLILKTGYHTTVAANDSVDTGFAIVAWAMAMLVDAPAINCSVAIANVGDQAGTPAAGFIQIKTYKPTSTSDTTPIAATAFSKTVAWCALGTRIRA